MRDFFLKNLGLKLLSVLFAISLWLFVNLKATEERDLQLPLRWENVPAFLEITNPVNDFVRVRVTGPRRILTNLNPRNFPVVLDLSTAQAGLMDYQVTEKMISLIPGLKVEVLPPDKVQFKFDLIVTVELPVIPTLIGKPPTGYSLARLEVKPDRIEIVGAQSEVMGLESAGTAPIDLSDLREDREEMVAVELKRAHVWPGAGGERVYVRLIVTEHELGRWFRNLRVEVDPPGSSVSVQPPAVDVYLKGPAGKVLGQKPDDLRVQVILPGSGEPLSSVPLLLKGPAEGVQSEIRPSMVVVTPLPRSP